MLKRVTVLKTSGKNVQTNTRVSELHQMYKTRTTMFRGLLWVQEQRQEEQMEQQKIFP